MRKILIATLVFVGVYLLFSSISFGGYIDVSHLDIKDQNLIAEQMETMTIDLVFYTVLFISGSLLFNRITGFATDHDTEAST